MGTWGNESLQYKVRAIDAAGLLSDYSSTVSITGEPNEDWGNNPEQSAFQATLVPEEYGLDKNFPNPFNPTTSMNYALPTTSRISLTIYDMLGRKIAVLAQGIQAAGYHTVRFNGSHFPSGMYVCRFTATPLNDEKLPFAETRKMVLAK